MERLRPAGLLPSPRALWEAARAWRMSREGNRGAEKEQALLAYLEKEVPPGDIDSTLAGIDRFCRTKAVMMNVGDEKGGIVEGAVRRAQPTLALELGTYCGYGALRIARAMPKQGRMLSLEVDPGRAEIARRVIDHAGAGGRVAVVVGDLGDGGGTLARLGEEQGVGKGAVGFLFIDHAKDLYLRDLLILLEHEVLAPGARIVADNLRIPGSPRYRDFIRAQEGRLFETVAHHTHLEYQRILPDLVFESVYLGRPGAAQAGRKTT
jgi:catechol O-methyltransferase